MKIEDYKAYMERVKTTAEMDERVLKNLKGSVTSEGASNKGLLQHPLQRTRTFLYRVSVAAVCCLVILLIGKFYTGVGLSNESSNTKNVQNDSTNTEADPKLLRTPSFSELYGKEISKYATKCNYVDEDTHIRICIQEIISDECITEVMGYYEAKDERGKTWLAEHESSDDFTFSIKPDMSEWPDKIELLDPYYSFQSGDFQAKWLKSYNTSKRTYFDHYFIASPDFKTESVNIGYKLYDIYDTTSIAIEKQMKAKSYPFRVAKERMEKHYQPTEVIFSPLGGLIIRGKDLGIEAASEKTIDNLSTLYLDLQDQEMEEMQTIPLVGNEVWGGFGTGYLEDCGRWWCANLLSEKQKKYLGEEYSLLICRLSPKIDTSKIIGIQIDDVHNYLDASNNLSLENTVEHSVSDEELNDLLKVMKKYYKEKMSWEVVDYRIADYSHSLYSLYKDYEAGNIIVFEVHTTNNPDGLLYRSIALGRKDKSAEWEVLNEGI